MSNESAVRVGVFIVIGTERALSAEQTRERVRHTDRHVTSDATVVLQVFAFATSNDLRLVRLSGNGTRF